MDYAHTLIKLAPGAQVAVGKSIRTESFTIYGLVDDAAPDEIRYVGRTSRKLSVRLVGHRSSARGGRRQPVHDWLRKLAEAGGSASIIEIEANASPDAEAFHIARLLPTGRLLNQNAGGLHGGAFPAARSRMSAAIRSAMSDPLVLRKYQGENHNLAKLTETSVREIRRRYAQGGVLQRELAAEYGVSDVAVSYALRGKTWANVTPEAEVS